MNVRDRSSSGERRRFARWAIGTGGGLLLLAAVIFGGGGLRDESEQEAYLVTVPEAAPRQDDSGASGWKDFVAQPNPERTAAQPPPGGPGPEDTRPAQLIGKIRFGLAYRGGAARGYRMYSSDPAFRANGFRDGDVLMVVDGQALGSGSLEAGLDINLRPGAMVAVERNGRTVEWRVGGKAE